MSTAPSAVPTVQLTLPVPEILAGLHGAIEETATKVMRTLLQEEVERLAGEKHKHNPDRQGLRWGKEESHVVAKALRDTALKKKSTRREDRVPEDAGAEPRVPRPPSRVTRWCGNPGVRWNGRPGAV